MPSDQSHTVFVSLLLRPGQSGLFNEIGTEAIEILGEDRESSSDFVLDGEELVMLDRDHLRIGLGWSAIPAGDVLTLAIGAHPDYILPEDEASVAAGMLRELLARAEALFETVQARWQIALLTLDVDTMNSHAMQLNALHSQAGYQVGSPFVTVDSTRAESDAAAAQNGTVAPMQAHAPDTQDAESAEPNWTMQVSALALSTTFVLVTPPVGFAMLAYAALRQGKDMDLLPRSIEIPRLEQPAALKASRSG